ITTRLHGLSALNIRYILSIVFTAKITSHITFSPSVQFITTKQSGAQVFLFHGIGENLVRHKLDTI
ncbi:TPA: hypothetical protein ACGSTT_004883, partial [Vibrio parahaemolyticus]